MSDYDWWYTCPGCGEIYNRGLNGTGKHTDCENRLTRLQRSPEQKMREQWDQMSSKVSPAIREKDGNKCVHCGATDYLTTDHKIPIYLGGDNNPDNLQTLCGTCNSRKGVRI